MDVKNIRKAVERVNDRFLDLQIKSHRPEVIIKTGNINWRKRGREVVPFSKWWPDSKKYEESILVRDFIVPLGSKSGAPIDCTSVEFFYRPSDPAMLVKWFQLFDVHRGGELGDRLLCLMNDVASELGVGENVYFSNVTYPLFWKDAGYAPFVKHENDEYWRRR